MIAAEFVFLAIALRLFSSANYLFATWRGAVKPNAITWFFWGVAPLIAFVAQLQEGVGLEAWMSLGLAVGPLAICAASIIRREARWKVTRFDIACGIFATVGLVLWQITSDPLVAIWFAIAADIAGGVPTLKKIYTHPDTEKPLPYFLSMISMVITLMTIHSWTVASAAFPVYILLINLVLFTLGWSKIGPRLQRRRVSPQSTEELYHSSKNPPD